MRRMVEFGLFGLLFGFVLSRVGATDYDAILGMFLLTDLHLMGVIGVAVVVLGVGLRLWKRVVPAGGAPNMDPKPFKPGLPLGAILFGAGWALTGACPGTALSQVGEGKVVALFSVAGIFLGTALHRRVGHVFERGVPRRKGPPTTQLRASGAVRTPADPGTV